MVRSVLTGLSVCLVMGCSSPGFEVGASAKEDGAPADSTSPPSDLGSDVAIDEGVSDVAVDTITIPDTGPPVCKSEVPPVSCVEGAVAPILDRPGTGTGLPLLAEKTAHRLDFVLGAAGRIDSLTVRFATKSAATAFGGPDGTVTAEVSYVPCADPKIPWVPLGTVTLDGALVGLSATFALKAPALPAGAHVAVVISTTSKAWVWELKTSTATTDAAWAIRSGTTPWTPSTKLGDVTVSAHACGT